MSSRVGIAWMSLLMACSGSGDTGDELSPQITGTIVAEDGKGEGIVEIYHGFGFDQGGVFISYFSSNPETDCDTITSHLQSHSAPYDPSEVLVGGTCDIYYKVSSGYEGELAASDDPMAAAGMAINKSSHKSLCTAVDCCEAQKKRSEGAARLLHRASRYRDHDAHSVHPPWHRPAAQRGRCFRRVVREGGRQQA